MKILSLGLGMVGLGLAACSHFGPPREPPQQTAPLHYSVAEQATTMPAADGVTQTLTMGGHPLRNGGMPTARIRSMRWSMKACATARRWRRHKTRCRRRARACALNGAIRCGRMSTWEPRLHGSVALTCQGWRSRRVSTTSLPPRCRLRIPSTLLALRRSQTGGWRPSCSSRCTSSMPRNARWRQTSSWPPSTPLRCRRSWLPRRNWWLWVNSERHR